MKRKKLSDRDIATSLGHDSHAGARVIQNLSPRTRKLYERAVRLLDDPKSKLRECYDASRAAYYSRKKDDLN